MIEVSSLVLLFFVILILSIEMELNKMIEQIYEQYLDFYDVIEKEYSNLIDNDLEWEVFHLRFLLYYLLRYNIDVIHPLISYHYRACYRLYIEQLLISNDYVGG